MFKYAGMALFVWAYTGQLFANVTLPSVFGSHMVLQREKPMVIWGSASPGESVQVTLNGVTQSNTASAGGSWRVSLPSMPAGGPYTLTVHGNNTLTLTDVMVGEVWQCAGQSNMDTRMNYWEYPNLADSIPLANFPLLRYITMRQPGQSIHWQNVTPSTAGALSATGYFFGRELLDNLAGVAVGLVVTAVGGTVVEQWMDPATVDAMPEVRVSDSTAGSMYTAWVKPVEGFALRGTIWIQGENNTRTSNYATYGTRLARLIEGWRRTWDYPEMPFLVGSLSYKGGLQTNANEASNAAAVREFQRRVTDTLAHSWFSVLMDLGDVDTWHYPQKSPAGRRLGKIARREVYGHTSVIAHSPRPTDCHRRGSSIVIPFDAGGSSLLLNSGNSPTGFAVAGANNVWSWATQAELVGDTIFLTTDVANPTQVRHAWANNPVWNLRSAAALPATPFLMPIREEPQAPLAETCERCTVQLQAEDFCSAQGWLESTHNGFAGLGYWNFENSITSQGQLTIDVSPSYNDYLFVRFANGGTAARSMEVFINGVTAGTLNFPVTSGWTEWRFDSLQVQLPTGSPEIEFRSLTVDGGPNMDYLAFTTTAIGAAECTGAVANTPTQWLAKKPIPVRGYSAKGVSVELESVKGTPFIIIGGPDEN